MTAFYGSFDREAQEPESLRTIAKAVELGITFLDTAWIYQNYSNGKLYTNEELVGKAIAIHGREKFIIATKFGIAVDSHGVRYFSGKEEVIRSQLADSLRRLGTDYIDLYYMHRMDPTTPIEETMMVLKSLVQEGKIRYIGLSECTPNELRRAHAVHPITAIQMEWSLQSRDIEESVVPIARELGVGIVAYSPLGRGFLADLATFDNLVETDSRRSRPRFTGENLEENRKRVARFYQLATEKGCTPAQLALAWVHSRGEDVFPIPGTKSSNRLEENVKAFAEVLPKLTTEDIVEIENSIETLVGNRYDDNAGQFNSRM